MLFAQSHSKTLRDFALALADGVPPLSESK